LILKVASKAANVGRALTSRGAQYVIKLPNTFESGRHCNFGDGQIRLCDEVLGKMNSTSDGDLQRRRAQMLDE
jgi:hypothetical protein